MSWFYWKVIWSYVSDKNIKVVTVVGVTNGTTITLL